MRGVILKIITLYIVRKFDRQLTQFKKIEIMMIEKNKTLKYLKKLTKNELIDIILKFAPENFINNINGQFYNKEKSLISFEKALDEIASIFSNDDLLYNPGQFEKELIEVLEKIRWAWSKLPIDNLSSG